MPTSRSNIRNHRVVRTAIGLAAVICLVTASMASAHQPAGSTDVSDIVDTVPAADVFLKEVDIANHADACAAIGSTADFFYKTQGGNPNGTHNVAPGVTVTVSGSEQAGYTVTINGGALADVLLKSQKERNNWYHFHPEVSSATPLFAPDKKAASHMSFCFNVQTALTIDKTAASDTITIGDAFAYDITVADVADGIDAINATVSDAMEPDGFDWTITAQDGVACSISDGDSDGFSDDLACSFPTLADGASYSLSVASNGTASAAECDTTATNTAFADADNANPVSDDASITVACGGLRVVKTAKHADPNSSPDLVATFQITDSNGATHQVDTGADGIACVDALPLGAATVVELSGPAGYALDADTENVTVSDADCPDPGAAATASFENVPLTDITWSVDSQHDGATSTIVDCQDGDGNSLPGYPVTLGGTGDGTDTLSDLLPTDPDVTVTCAFTVDP